MVTIRFEARNLEGRLTTVLEKDFAYSNARTIALWMKDEIFNAIHTGQTITIRRINEEA